MTNSRISLPSARQPPKPLGRIVRFLTTDGQESRVLDGSAAARRFQSDAMQWPASGGPQPTTTSEVRGRAHGAQTPPRPPPPVAGPSDVTARLTDRIHAEMGRLRPVRVTGSLADLDALDASPPGELAHPAGDATTQHVQNIGCAEFIDPASNRRYLITNVEKRVFSAAKRRRFVIDSTGRFYCGLEFKALEELMRPDTYGFSKRKVMFEANIREELAKDTIFNKSTYVHKLLKDEDGHYIALVNNLPEEASYLLGNLPDSHFVGGLIKLLEEVSERVVEDFHSKGWLHGDLKLENTMITPQRRFVPIDFESVAPVDASGLADIQRCMWAAPEMQRPKNRSGYFGRVGQPADVYALGVSLLHAVVSRAETQRIGKLPLAEQRVAMEHSDMMVKGALGYLGSELFSGVCTKYLNNDPTLYDDPNEQAYRFLLEPFQAQAPDLLRFVLGSMVNADPQARASMAAVNAAAQLMALGRADKVLAADKAMGESIDRCMSAYVEPLLRKAAEQQWAKPGPSLPAIDEEET